MTEPRPSMERARRVTHAVALCLIALIAVFEGWRATTRSFDEDEFQHVHAGWRWSRGAVPYRDFFEHHAPSLAGGLAVVLRRLPVETSLRSAIRTLRGLRCFFWLEAVLLLFITAQVAAVLGANGLVAAALLAGVGLFWEKSVEIRPDGPATCLMMMGTLALLRFGGDDRRSLLRAGGAWGAALTFTPKVAVAVLGFLAAAGDTFSGGVPGRVRLRRILTASAAVAVFPMLWGLGLGLAGALPSFLRYGVLWNATWRSHFGWGEVANALWRQNAVFVVLALGGTVAAALTRSPLHRRWLWVAASTAIGLAVNPIPYAQSFLPLFPLGAVAGALLLENIRGRLRPTWIGAADVVLALTLIASAAPALFNRLAHFEGNRRQLALLGVVNDAVPPSAPVLDAWTGLGVFRPDATFFPHDHAEIVRMLPDGWADALTSRLLSGEVRPVGLLGHRYWRALNPNLDRWVGEFYEPVEGNVVWRRRTAPAESLAP